MQIASGTTCIRGLKLGSTSAAGPTTYWGVLVCCSTNAPRPSAWPSVRSNWLLVSQASQPMPFIYWRYRDPFRQVDAEQGETHYRKALTHTEPRGMRLLIAHCYLGLGKLYKRTSKGEQARVPGDGYALLARAGGVRDE